MNEISHKAKSDCFEKMKIILKFPEFPNKTFFTRVPKNSFVESRSEPVGQLNVTKIHFDKEIGVENFDCVDVELPEIIEETTPQPIPTSPTLELAFLKCGQSQIIQPHLIFNLQPRLTIYKDLNNYVYNKKFNSSGIDFSKFFWNKGSPESVFLILLPDSTKQSIDDLSSISDTINQFDFYLKKWIGEIAERLMFLFPYDIPLDLCFSIGGKFLSEFPKANLCWNLMMAKFPQFEKVNYSAFEVFL